MIAWLLLAGPLALAQEGAPIDSWGEVRLVGATLTDFPVDADGTLHGREQWVESRVRLGVGGEVDVWTWGAEADFFSGVLAGDTWAIDNDIDARHLDRHGALTSDGVVPRQAWVQGVVGDFQVQFGLQTSHWGLGLLANDGSTEPLFGRAQLGDRVMRLRATTMPAARRVQPVVTTAVDLVVDDGTAVLADGQVAFNGILSGLWIEPDLDRYGFYAVFRQQWDTEPGRTLSVGVVDGYGDVTLDAMAGWHLRLAGESALITGFTDRSTTYNARDGVAVLQVGAVGVASLERDDEAMRAELWAGTATGDGDPDDKWQTEYTADADLGVGMVLFDEVFGSVDAASWALLTDPELAGQPPDGVDALVREGAFRNATFVQPVLAARPVEGVEVRTGLLLAWANAPVTHPLYSYRAGGTPTNHHGLPSEGRHLGTEWDWAVEVGDEQGGADLVLGLQGGHLNLGRPLQGAGPRWVHHLLATGRVSW